MTLERSILLDDPEDRDIDAGADILGAKERRRRTLLLALCDRVEQLGERLNQVATSSGLMVAFIALTKRDGKRAWVRSDRITAIVEDPEGITVFAQDAVILTQNSPEDILQPCDFCGLRIVAGENLEPSEWLINYLQARRGHEREETGMKLHTFIAVRDCLKRLRGELAAQQQRHESLPKDTPMASLDMLRETIGRLKLLSPRLGGELEAISDLSNDRTVDAEGNASGIVQKWIEAVLAEKPADREQIIADESQPVFFYHCIGYYPEPKQEEHDRRSNP